MDDDFVDEVLRNAKASYEEARLISFLTESNRIEGEGPPDGLELAVTTAVLHADRVDLQNLCDLAVVYAGGKARLRSKQGMNVVVGTHRPPPGGSEVVDRLEVLLVNGDNADPWRFHVAYEALHPFMDGNGRTGRTLWARHMLKAGQDPFSLPFLHRAYYQALDHARGVE